MISTQMTLKQYWSDFMALFVDKFREYAPCLLRLEFGTPEHSPATWYLDDTGKAHTISFDAFVERSRSALKSGSRPVLQDHDFFVALIYPL